MYIEQGGFVYLNSVVITYLLLELLVSLCEEIRILEAKGSLYTPPS